MPQTINGIGTWYYGKNNVYTTRGVCQHCGAYSQLNSYDTTTYFVFLFVPLFPLKRVRVLDACARCTQHSMLPLRTWRRLKTEDVQRTVDALQANPRDPETIRDVLGTFVTYQDEQSFLTAAGSLAVAAQKQPENLFLLGVAHDFFGHRPQAEEAYKAALKLDDTPDTRESLAINLAMQLRPKEAWEHASHVLAAKDPQKLFLLGLTIDTCQATGDHALALRVIDEAIALFPDLAEDPSLVEMRATSERHRDTGVKLVAEIFKPPVAVRESAMGGLLPRLAGPVLLLLLMLAYTGAAVSKGAAREVRLVSGLDRPYRVQIGGRTIELAPNTHTTVRIPEGLISVQPVEGSLPIEAQECRIVTPFWSRPFDQRLFVINPDRTALVLWEQTVYAGIAHDMNPAPPKLHVGRLLYRFEEVDYAFREFPAQLEAKKGTRLTKDRVALIPGAPSQRVAMVHTHVGPQQGIELAKRFLSYSPQDEQLLAMLLAIAPPADALAYLQAGLSARPIRIDWHRHYQALSERVRPDHDLVAEYRKQLEASPDDGALCYLLGRVLADPAQSAAMFRRATGKSPPCAYGHHALAFGHLSRGRFPEALVESRKAMAMEPKREAFRAGEERALWALGKFEEVLARLERRRQKRPGSFLLVSEIVRAHLRLRREGEARQVLGRFARDLVKEMPKKEAGEVARKAQAEFAYAKGDLKRYAELVADTDPGGAFRAAVARRNISAAHKAADAIGYQLDPVFHLLPLILARDAGDAAAAKRALAEALKVLSKGQTQEVRQAVAVLAGKAKARPERLLGLSLDPGTKRVILVALGQQLEQDRERYFALARKLNYARTFPHHLLREVLGN